MSYSFPSLDTIVQLSIYKLDSEKRRKISNHYHNDGGHNDDKGGGE